MTGALEPRLLEVLLSAVDGEPIVETAERLGVSVVTVTARRRRLLDALGANTIAAAVARAYHLGILVAPPHDLERLPRCDKRGCIGGCGDPRHEAKTARGRRRYRRLNG